MESTHYPSAAYNVEPAEAFPDYTDDQLVGKTDDEIETMVLQAMGLAPSNDTQTGMEGANFEPRRGVDQVKLDHHIDELIEQRDDALAGVTQERQSVSETLIPPSETKEEPPESARAA